MPAHAYQMGSPSSWDSPSVTKVIALISFFAVHRHFHWLPVGGVAVVHPVLLDQDPMASSRAVGDDGRIVPVLLSMEVSPGGVPVLLQDQVFLPAPLFVILWEVLGRAFQASEN